MDRIALNYNDCKITYGKLFENIEKTAKAYQGLGVHAGDIVSVIAVTLPETIYTFYGLNRIGAISNMIDPRTSIEGIKDYVLETNSKVVVVLNAIYEKCIRAFKDTLVEKIIVLSPADSLQFFKKILYKLTNKTRIEENNSCYYWERFMACEKGQVLKEVSYKGEECCVIVHTGGTSGVPKGVMLSNDNLNQSVFQGINNAIDTRRIHKWLNIMPPFIAYGVGMGLHLPLVVGMEVILIPAFNPKKFLHLLVKYHPNHMVGVPSHYENIKKSKLLLHKDLPYLISPIVGGDAMRIDLEEGINQFLKNHKCPSRIVKGYGMTEISALASVCINECNKIGSVGVPCSHTIVSIFDPETGEELKICQKGEVCISGPNTMLGYYKNEEETNRILRLHQDGKTWVHSGDLGYMDEDGMLFIVGRLKRMIVRHDGFKVFPTLIERVIRKNTSVQDCCAVGVKDEKHTQGQLPIVYIVMKGDGSQIQKQTVTELVNLCKKELPEYAQPHGYYFIEALPLTPIGKVDYQELEKRYTCMESI